MVDLQSAKNFDKNKNSSYEVDRALFEEKWMTYRIQNNAIKSETDMGFGQSFVSQIQIP